MNRAQRRLSLSVLRRVLEDPSIWIWCIDTTANMKRTANLTGRGLWANSKDEIFFGQNMMMICAVNVNTGESIPVYWLPCLKESERDKNKTNHYLVLKLMDKLQDDGWPKLDLVMDAWYDSVELMENLNQKNIRYVIQLKSNRKPKNSPGPRVRRWSLPEMFSKIQRASIRLTTRKNKIPKCVGWKNLRFFSGKIVWINGSKEGGKQIQIKVTAVYNHPKERNAFGYYATNDLSKPYTWSWEMSRYRWNMEVGFRDLRQGFNWGKLPAKNVEMADFSWIMPILILAFIRETTPEIPILTVLEDVIKNEVMNSIDYHAENPNNKLREKLRIRIMGTPACKKVKITAAEMRNNDNKYDSSIKIAA